jgi:hypothetical protein
MQTLKKIADWPFHTLASNSVTKPLISGLRRNPEVTYTLIAAGTPYVFTSAADAGKYTRTKATEAYTDFMMPRVQPPMTLDPNLQDKVTVRLETDKGPIYKEIPSSLAKADTFYYGDKKAHVVKGIEGKTLWNETDWLKKVAEKQITSNDFGKYVTKIKKESDPFKKYKYYKKIKHALEKDQSWFGIGGVRNMWWTPNYVDKKIKEIESKFNK